MHCRCFRFDSAITLYMKINTTRAKLRSRRPFLKCNPYAIFSEKTSLTNEQQVNPHKHRCVLQFVLCLISSIIIMDEGSFLDASTSLSRIHLFNAFQKILRKIHGTLVHEILNSYMELQTFSERLLLQREMLRHPAYHCPWSRFCTRLSIAIVLTTFPRKFLKRSQNPRM